MDASSIPLRSVNMSEKLCLQWNDLQENIKTFKIRVCTSETYPQNLFFCEDLISLSTANLMDTHHMFSQTFCLDNTRCTQFATYRFVSGVNLSVSFQFACREKHLITCRALVCFCSFCMNSHVLFHIRFDEKRFGTLCAHVSLFSFMMMLLNVCW